MEEKGYLLLALHTHQAYVRHPEHRESLEEKWLFEALTESYIPLLDMCGRLLDDGIRSNLTFSLSPCLACMLADDLHRQRYLDYLDERISHLARAIEDPGCSQELSQVLRMHYQHYRRCRGLFVDVLRQDVIAGFRRLQDAEAVTVITSAATHAYFPLWELYPDIVQFQIELGIRQYAADFGHRPKGIWLPECGYFDGLDRFLSGNALGYSFLDSHGILNAKPRPQAGQYAPSHTPTGLAVFGRDWDSHDRVWLKDRGYPGDPVYLDVHAKPPLGRGDRPAGAGLHLPSGIPLFCGSSGGDPAPYDPAEARARCETHAEHFVARCQERVECLSHGLERRPLLVALFDTEHFGHWWYEGPIWLENVIRLLSRENSSVRLITPEQYLAQYPINQVVSPSTSSWGYQGYSETWLMGRNHWVYPPLFAAIDFLRDQAARGLTDEDAESAFLDQYIRELLVAQGSDWAFMMHAETTQSYAEDRVKGHIENMLQIRRQVSHSPYDWAWLETIRGRNKVFSSINLFELYASIRSG